MKYLLAIYSDEKVDASATKEEMEAWMGQYNAYTEGMQKAGVMLAGEALHPTFAATTVRVQKGKQVTPPTVPLPRPKNNSAGITWSMSKISTKPSHGRLNAQAQPSARSKSGR